MTVNMNGETWTGVRRVAVRYKKLDLVFDDRETTIHTKDCPIVHIDEAEGSET